MRSLKWGLLGLLVLALPADAAKVPLQTGVNCGQASQLQPCVNGAINSINSNIGGVIASLPGPFTTSGTGANTLLSTVIPANSLVPGNVIHVKLWGLNPADGNVRTITLAFGTSLTANVVVTGSGLVWQGDFWITIQTTAIQAMTGLSQVTTTSTITTNVAGTESTAVANTVLLTFTNATSGVTPIYGAYIEVIK